jgi:hypothetical protein
MEIEPFLPNVFLVVSPCFDSRIDVVPSPGNDFFIPPSLTSLNQLPHQQKVEISRQLIAIETIVNAPLGLPSGGPSAPGAAPHVLIRFYYSSAWIRPVRLTYQPPANSTILSEQTSHQQPVSGIFLSEQISISHQPPTKRTGRTAAKSPLSPASQKCSPLLFWEPDLC